MEEILHQLRLVISPVIYRVFYISGVCLGFLNHQQYFTEQDMTKVMCRSTRCFLCLHHLDISNGCIQVTKDLQPPMDATQLHPKASAVWNYHSKVPISAAIPIFQPHLKIWGDQMQSMGQVRWICQCFTVVIFIKHTWTRFPEEVTCTRLRPATVCQFHLRMLPRTFRPPAFSTSRKHSYESLVFLLLSL